MNKGTLGKLGGGAVAVIIFLGIIALKLGLFSGIGFLAEKATAPEVGECVLLTGAADDANVDKKDCDDDKVLWKVVDTKGNCDEVETNYTVGMGDAKAVNLCLYYNVSKGDCLEVNPNDEDSLEVKVACTKKATKDTFIVQVASVNDSATAKCGKDEFAVSNVKRKSTICLGQPA